MIKFRIAVIFLCFSMFTMLSCQEDPSFVIPEEKLINILCDVHIAEASLKDLSIDEKEEAAKLVYDQIYTLHSINQAELDSALNILKHDPKSMENIYKKVVQELEKMEHE